MRRAAIAAALLLMSFLSWKVFPGHTWLQQDTQIYAPILEHLRDPQVLSRDILVEHPHVSFTLYDELTLGLVKLTGLGLEPVLDGLQIVFRAVGLWGVFLIAESLGLETGPALLLVLLWSLGATAKGPEVLTVEYEAVPRGFAFPLLMLAVGFASRANWRLSGFATAAAVLIHPPTVWPVLLIYLGHRRWQALAPVAGAVVVLAAVAKFETGGSESQHCFAVLPPALEALQRMRAAYNWIDTWWLEFLPQYVFLSFLIWLAVRRLPVRQELRAFAYGLPVLALLSVPSTFLTLNVGKWALLPQLQPMRALLFITALGSVLLAAAGCVAVRERKYAEAFLWMLVPVLLPMHTNLFRPPTAIHALVWLSLTGVLVLAVRHLWLIPAAAGAYWVMAATVVLYPQMHAAVIDDLAGWAAKNTPRDAVFLFADNGKANAPGIFRAEALRAVYVDWKGGGQVNYLPAFAEEWYRRWQAMRQTDGPHYAALGVDYIVTSAGHEVPAAGKVYENSRYWVYKAK